MPESTTAIVDDQAVKPEREIRHELLTVGQWTLMVSYYGPDSKHAYNGAHVELAAWAWIDGAKCRMEFGLPLAGMQAIYKALGKVLPPADSNGIEPNYEAAVADLNPVFGGAWADLQSETEAIDGDQVL